MAVTLEEVEKLRAKADVSYEEAKQALEESRGDLLEALIALERQGRTRTAGHGSFYSTRPGAAQPEGTRGDDRARAAEASCAEGAQRSRPHGGFWAQLLALLRAGLRALRPSNRFEVWHRGEQMTSMPVVILLALLLVAFWISAPLLIVGLFFGCRYRFSGCDLPDGQMNAAMDAVSDTVDGVKKTFDQSKKW